VLGGVAPVPWRAPSAEALLAGAAPAPELFERAAWEALKEAVPLSENAYKVPLTRALIVRALERLAGKA
jgi:xanthine dehydrogenase YagS FAD-binding subunit